MPGLQDGLRREVGPVPPRADPRADWGWYLVAKHNTEPPLRPPPPQVLVPELFYDVIDGDPMAGEPRAVWDWYLVKG